MPSGGKTLSAQEIITETGEKLLMSTVTRDLYNMRGGAYPVRGIPG